MMKPCSYFLIAAGIAFLASCAPSYPGKKPPAAVNGTIDLRGWDFEKDGPVTLAGEWMFFPGHLYTPADLENPGESLRSGLLEAPAVWNDREAAGVRLHAEGSGTYRLQVLLPERALLAMRMDYQGSAAHFYWNAERIGESGTPGVTRDQERSRWLVRYAPLPGGSGFITVPVSNHIHRQGGLWLPIEIGSANDIFRRRDFARATETFLAGSLVIMGLYHIGLFVYRRKDAAALWFGILCIAVVLRLLFTGERILSDATGWPLAVTLKMEYLGYYLAAPAALWFLGSLVPAIVSVRINRIAAGISGAFVLSVLVLPASLYTRGLLLHHLWALVLSIYVFVHLLVACVRSQPGARLIASGWGVFLATLVNDILYNELLIGAGFIVPLGIFVLTATQAAALSRRIATAFNKSEELSAHLQTSFEEAVRLREKLVEKEKLATIGDMASGIVHDLKNPVGIIKGAVEMADGSDVTPLERRELHRMIDQEADRMLSLVQDLLDFSRGLVLIEKQDVNAAEYLTRIEKTIEPYFKPRGLTLSTSCQYQDPFRIDPDRFLRVLVNVAGNSADALQPGGSFSLSVKGQAGRAVFTLSDNGPGIPESIRETLFQPFVTHGKASGTGLGMAIAKSMVEAHGGTISFETQTGKGTTFTIEVPA